MEPKMVAAFNEFPNFCPECGKQNNVDMSNQVVRMYYREAKGGVAMGCTCGCKWAIIPQKLILEATDKHGSDLRPAVEGG